MNVVVLFLAIRQLFFLIGELWWIRIPVLKKSWIDFWTNSTATEHWPSSKPRTRFESWVHFKASCFLFRWPSTTSSKRRPLPVCPRVAVSMIRYRPLIKLIIKFISQINCTSRNSASTCYIYFRPSLRPSVFASPWSKSALHWRCRGSSSRWRGSPVEWSSNCWYYLAISQYSCSCTSTSTEYSTTTTVYRTFHHSLKAKSPSRQSSKSLFPALQSQRSGSLLTPHVSPRCPRTCGSRLTSQGTRAKGPQDCYSTIATSKYIHRPL